jgi:hypothetical protein
LLQDGQRTWDLKLADAVLAAAGTIYQVERAATRAALSLIPASMLKLV